MPHAAHWAAALRRTKFEYLVTSRSQKVVPAAKAWDSPSQPQGDLSLHLLPRSALPVKVCQPPPVGHSSEPWGAPGWRCLKQGFPAQHLRRAPSFSRNVAERHLWRCQYLLSAYRGNLQQGSWTRYITLIWLQRDEMNLGHILPLLITLWLT